MIIFRSESFKHTIRIAEHSSVHIWFLNDNKTYSGKIRKISSDTICLTDTCFRVADARSLQLGNKLVNEIGKQWEVIVPPEEIYSSPPYRTLYLHNLEQQSARTWRTSRHNSFRNIPYDNFIKINAARLFHLELALAYEHIFHGKTGFELELGYEVAFTHFYFMNYKNPVNAFSGPSLLAGVRFYNKGKFYLGPELHLKYLEMYKHTTQYPAMKGAASMQDQYKSVYGLSVRGGMIRNLKGFILEIYSGLGVKFENGVQVGYYYYPSSDNDSHLYFNPEHTPVRGSFTAWYPIVNLGVKLGFGF